MSEHDAHVQLDLLDPPIRVAQARNERLYRCTTIKEDRLLAEVFPRPDCTLAMGEAVYAAMARIGIRERNKRGSVLGPSDWFEASREDLAAEVGARPRTLGPYLAALRKRGLLERRRRRQGSNLWRLPHLREPGSRMATDRQSSEQGRRSIADQAASRLATGRQPLQEKKTQEGNIVRFPDQSGQGEAPRDPYAVER